VIISGRPPETLDAWFGHLPVDMAAEHGHFVKQQPNAWRRLTPENDQWKAAVLARMEVAVQGVSGSFVEEKHTSLVWHYRQAEASRAKEVAEALAQELTALPEIQVSQGAKIVEARQLGTDKGKVAELWLAENSHDFILAAGDDTTDEDLFVALPAQAFTVKVGAGPTAARERIATPADLVAWLQKFSTK
jgi:trehalose 6-phosphate synthase/phosphatase